MFPALVENRQPEDPIRIWVPGCATGEEAYSIAICLTEFLDDRKDELSARDFRHRYQRNRDRKGARRLLQRVRHWRSVSPQRLTRFFTRSDRGYQVAKNIRDVMRFCPAQCGTGPPFSRLDLISCCNVLIYLGTDLQRKVLSILHYALKPAGFLVLGPSESIGTLSDSFHQLEKTHKIYTLLPAAAKPVPRLNREPRLCGSGESPRRELPKAEPDLLREADRLVLAEHGPPGAVDRR